MVKIIADVNCTFYSKEEDGEIKYGAHLVVKETEEYFIEAATLQAILAALQERAANVNKIYKEPDFVGWRRMYLPDDAQPV